MEFKSLFSQIIYRIDRKPGGGFVATCKDPSAPAIEGATREEVQQKIQQAIASKVGEQFPMFKDALASKGVTLHYHVEAKPGGGFIIHHDDAEHHSTDDSSHHIESIVESKIFSRLIDRLPPELHQQLTDKLNSGGLDITVDRNFSVTTQTRVPHFSPALGEVGTSMDQSRNVSPVLGEVGNSTTDLQPADSTNQSPIIRYDSGSPVQYEKSSLGKFLRLLLALAILALLAFVFLHRR